MSTPDTNLFPVRLADSRKRLGISQSELARQLGVSPSVISAYESGEYQPRTKKIEQIAGAVKVPAAYLLGLTGSSESPEPTAEGQNAHESNLETSPLQIQGGPRIQALAKEIMESEYLETPEELLYFLLRERAKREECEKPKSGLEAARARRDAKRAQRGG